MHFQEETFSDHGDIMPLNIEFVIGKVNGSTNSEQVTCDNKTYEPSDVMYLDTCSDDITLTGKPIDLGNKQACKISSLDAKIGTDSDVQRTNKRIEDEQNGCKPNKMRADKISQREGKIILDRKQEIELPENVSVNDVLPNQTKKRRRRKKKQKVVDRHTSVEEKASTPDIGTVEAMKKTNVKSEQTLKVHMYSYPKRNCEKSREKSKLCLFLAMYLFFLSLVSCNVTTKPSEVKWKRLTDVITFGKPVLLHCKKKGVGSFCNGTRRWTKGISQSNLVQDGTSSNETKYKEKVDEDCSGAILYIYSFNEEDIGTYTCAHEFDEYTDTIKLETNRYRSFPDVSKIKKSIECGNGTFLVEFMLQDVYPVPICIVYTQVENRTIDGTPQNLSRSSTIYTVDYKMNDLKCNGELYVYCRIADKIIDIINHTYSCCKELKRNLDEDDNENSNIMTVLIIIPLVCVGILGLVVLLRRKAAYRFECLKRKECPTELENLNNNHQNKDADGSSLYSKKGRMIENGTKEENGIMVEYRKEEKDALK